MYWFKCLPLRIKIANINFCVSLLVYAHKDISIINIIASVQRNTIHYAYIMYIILRY